MRVGGGSLVDGRLRVGWGQLSEGEVRVGKRHVSREVIGRKGYARDKC